MTDSSASTPQFPVTSSLLKPPAPESGLACDPTAPGLWTYVARVLRIIDGDTLDVVVDLGLGHRAFPRLRLCGIDTPELYTRAGRQARDFVERALTDSPAVVISTSRTDTYGRYLADVKYLRHEASSTLILAKGIYLNAQLLREKLATHYLG